MDHYAPISNPHRPVRVPYLGGQYDDLDFAGYPSRHNWDIDRLREGDFQGASRRDAAQFLQTWLYFGLLHEVLDMPIAAADFFRPDGPQEYVITTAKLADYLRSWKLRSEQLSPGAREVHNDRVVEGFNSSYYVWRGFVDRERDHGNPNPIPPEIELSIQILATTLEHCANVAFDVPVAALPWRLARNPWLTRRMIGDGWCPTVIEQIWNPTHLAIQYYASILGPPARRLDHSTCEAGNRGCNARTVIDAVYVTEHKTVLCKCGFFGPNPEDLSRIVAASEIPLVSITWGASGPSLELVPFQHGLKYTVISHVWSDGLGNPRGNSLPECQLKELSRLISALYSNGQPGNNAVHVRPAILETELNSLSLGQKEPGQQQYFWMDTLCVPVRPLELRKAAIAKMRVVYSEAERALVLDADLMQSTANTTFEAIFTRISISTWTRRLWTLQEAVLAKSRHFQFAERAVVVDTDSAIGQTRDRDLETNFHNEVGWYCHDYKFNWQSSVPYWSEMEQMISVWGSLPHRSTSKPADEPICIATLLNMDLPQLLHTPDALKVQRLWSMHVHGVPSAVLFLPGPKLTHPGYRWAPASYMHCGRYGIPITVIGRVTPQGLSVVLPGFTLSTPRAPTREVIACDLDGQTYYIRQNVKHGNPSWEGLDVHEMDNLAVILGQERMEHDPLERRPLVACVGALVRVEREEEGEGLFVRYLRMVSVIGRGCRYDRHPNPPWSEGEGVEKGRVVGARWRRVDQRWCVG